MSRKDYVKHFKKRCKYTTRGFKVVQSKEQYPCVDVLIKFLSLEEHYYYSKDLSPDLSLWVSSLSKEEILEELYKRMARINISNLYQYSIYNLLTQTLEVRFNLSKEDIVYEYIKHNYKRFPKKKKLEELLSIINNTEISLTAFEYSCYISKLIN